MERDLLVLIKKNLTTLVGEALAEERLPLLRESILFLMVWTEQGRLYCSLMSTAVVRGSA